MRNWSTVISIPPTLATVERPKPRKMSPIPQIAKLMIKKPTTVAITTLPSQLEEAVRRPRSMSQTCLIEKPLRPASDQGSRIIRRGTLRRNIHKARQNRGCGGFLELFSAGMEPSAVIPGRAARREPGIHNHEPGL